MIISPASAIVAAWLVWLVIWILAAGWSARTASHHDLGAESPSRVLTLAAIVMILISYWPISSGRLWITPAPFGWALFALALIGFIFTWMARLHLGPLWSSTSAPTEDHRIVDTGPYAIVRHPMYTSALFLFIGVPLLLGSWLGLAFSALFILAIAWRAVHEERVLRAELSGYDDYAARVRYRFIPFVW